MSTQATRSIPARSVLIGTALLSFAAVAHGSTSVAQEPPLLPEQAQHGAPQPAQVPVSEILPAQTPHSAIPAKPARPRLVQDVDFNVYYSPAAGFKHGGSKRGDSSIQRYHLNYTVGYGLAEGLWVQGGVHGNYMSLNPDAGVLLPSHLQAIGLFGSATKDLSDLIGRGWGTTLILRPMLTSSSSDFSASGVVVQGGWVVSYTQSETVRWSGGIAFSTHTSGWGVLPIIGLQWDIDEDWLLSVGFPETHISYKLTEDTTLKGIVGFMQGSYRVKNAPIPGGGDTYVDFREIRIGAGVAHQFTEILSVELDVGAVVDRKFDYYDRDYKLKGDVAAYLNLSVNVQF